MIEDGANYKAAKLAKIARLLTPGQNEASDEEAIRAFAENIRQNIAKANLPARLKDLSVSIEQLALAAEDAGQLDIVNSLPKSMTSDDLFALIKTAY